MSTSLPALAVSRSGSSVAASPAPVRAASADKFMPNDGAWEAPSKESVKIAAAKSARSKDDPAFWEIGDAARDAAAFASAAARAAAAASSGVGSCRSRKPDRVVECLPVCV